jgi:hypothetical protein
MAHAGQGLVDELGVGKTGPRPDAKFGLFATQRTISRSAETGFEAPDGLSTLLRMDMLQPSGF